MLENESPLKKSDQNLVWLDCEMTGLDPEKERLIEIAIIITGPHLTPRIEGPVLVIHQSNDVLAQMDKWNQGTHGKSGLIDKLKANATVSDALAKLDELRSATWKMLVPDPGSSAELVADDADALTPRLPLLLAAPASKGLFK